jgi:DNA repair protein RecO (recombination protein O)
MAEGIVSTAWGEDSSRFGESCPGASCLGASARGRRWAHSGLARGYTEGNDPLALVENTPAILLRKTRLTETSLIVTWLTRDLGKLKTVAKGARQAKSRFAGVLDLYYRCEIGLVRSRQSELHALREATLLEPYENLRFDYTRTAMAGYFVELLDLVTEPEHAAPELFDLLHRAFAHLHAQAATERALLHFESELTRLLGIAQPNLSPALALGRTYQTLPRGRGELLARLR